MTVSLYVSAYFSSRRWIGVLLWDQGYQLVTIEAYIKNSLTIVLILFRFANYAWIPVFVIFVIAAGVDGKYFINFQTEDTSIVQIFTFGSTVAGFMLSWAVISSDYTAYFHPDVHRSVGFHGCLHHSLISTNQNSWRIFMYAYAGLTIPTVRNPPVARLSIPLTAYYRSLSSA